MTHNERKRLAKARHNELVLAQKEAFAAQELRLVAAKEALEANTDLNRSIYGSWFARTGFIRAYDRAGSVVTNSGKRAFKRA